MSPLATTLLSMSLLTATPPASPPSLGLPGPTEAGVSTDTIAVVDDDGREIRLDAPARRIVSLVPAITELLFAIGAGDRVVGRTRFDEHPTEALDIPSVGDGIRPAAELVAARRPDLVVLYSGPENRRSVAELQRIGLRVLAVRHDRLADLERNVLRMGRLTGCREEAEALLRRIRDGLERVAASIRGLPIRRVYYDVWGDPPVTVGRGSFLDSLITMAGGRNVFGELPAASPQVSVEAIAVRRPEVVLWPVSAGEGAARTHPRERHGWEVVDAVRREAVRPVDADLVHRLGPRVAEAAAAVARAIHPDAPLAEEVLQRPTGRGNDPMRRLPGPAGPNAGGSTCGPP